jgi:hypothetical protein
MTDQMSRIRATGTSPHLPPSGKSGQWSPGHVTGVVIWYLVHVCVYHTVMFFVGGIF